MMIPNAMPTFAPVERPLPEPEFDGSTVGVGLAEVDVVEEVPLEALDLVLLVLLRVLDEALEADVELRIVLRDIVVGVLTITSVIPEMTVVNPESEYAEFTGNVASPEMIISVTPLITVTCATSDSEFGSGNVVAEGMIKKGVPSIVVVTPVSPGGALDRGI
jgi:hypothetical protein